jgi:ADP-ribose pyrophosphatase YjhB (NUDIX family)
MQKGFDYIGVSVVTMCHDGNGKYLLEYRSDKCRDEHFTWSPVGSGGVEQGESLEDAVRREVKEECGAAAYDIEYMGFRQVFREIDGRKSHYIAFDFKTRIDPNDISITEPEKCLKLEWYPIDAIPKPMHSQFPVFLEQHKDKL